MTLSLQQTRAWVTTLHAGQVDQAGAPYIGHLERVAAHLQRLFPDATPDERHAAWLHDAIEDASVTPDDLRAHGYSEATIAIILAVTKPKDSDIDYAARIDALIAKCNRSALRVKLADLSDNLDPIRLASLPPGRASSLRRRYEAAYARIAAELGAGEI